MYTLPGAGTISNTFSCREEGRINAGSKPYHQHGLHHRQQCSSGEILRDYYRTVKVS